MLDFIAQYWIEVLFGLAVGALGVGYRQVVKRLREYATLKAGMLAILHDRLYQICRYHIHKGLITVDELDNIEHLYNAYHDLGGNGTGEEIYNRVRRLPLQKREE